MHSVPWNHLSSHRAPAVAAKQASRKERFWLQQVPVLSSYHCRCYCQEVTEMTLLNYTACNGVRRGVPTNLILKSLLLSTYYTQQAKWQAGGGGVRQIRLATGSARSHCCSELQLINLDKESHTGINHTGIQLLGCI